MKILPKHQIIPRKLPRTKCAASTKNTLRSPFAASSSFGELWREFGGEEIKLQLWVCLAWNHAGFSVF
jgi:hypothetical protein